MVKSLKALIFLSTVMFALLLIPSMAFAESLDGSNQNPYYTITKSSGFLLTGEDSNMIVKGSWKDRKIIHLKGKGTLEANGDGACRIKATTNDIEDGIISVSGDGVLLIRDLKGDIEKSVSGYGGMVEIKENFWLYYGFKGKAEIKGSGFVVNIFGNDIDLYAKGRGVVFLAGDGTYTVYRNKDETNPSL